MKIRCVHAVPGTVLVDVIRIFENANFTYGFSLHFTARTGTLVDY